MNENTKAIMNVVVNCLIALCGVVLAAAQPQNQWAWVQFVAGLGLAILGVMRGALNDSPKTAKMIDARADVLATKQAEKQVQNFIDTGVLPAAKEG